MKENKKKIFCIFYSNLNKVGSHPLLDNFTYLHFSIHRKSHPKARFL